MPRTITGYISSKGEYLTPIQADSDNITDLVSTKGVYYQALYSSAYEEGNPLGLLLALTYTEYVAPPEPEVGNPLGMLLTLTYAE